MSSIIINYLIGMHLSKNDDAKQLKKKVLLFVGLTINITLLGYYKYADFLITNLNYIVNSNFSPLNLLLPLAISFFTFQQIAYLVDCYRNEIKEHNFLNYAMFVSFFPQLIAGPIVHHKEMMSQFADVQNNIVNYKNIGTGLFIFSIGLFKKVVIADSFAVWATNGFDKVELLLFFEAWATSLSYTFQLYFDFTGYTDMAIGAALLFNIKLPINFDSPYKSVNIQDFWRRWHITLSSFLKNYIYIPLGGNQKSTFVTYFNLMVTFIIGGLWHGAGWTFVFWGFLHGTALVLHRLWKGLGFKLNTVSGWFLTFNFVNFAWVFFRAKEWNDAIKVLKGMLGLNGIKYSDSFVSIYYNTIKQLSFLMPDIKGVDSNLFNFRFDTYFWIGLAFIIILKFPNSQQIMHYPLMTQSNILNIKKAILYSTIFMVGLLFMSISTYSEFIYFNF